MDGDARFLDERLVQQANLQILVIGKRGSKLSNCGMQIETPQARWLEAWKLGYPSTLMISDTHKKSMVTLGEHPSSSPKEPSLDRTGFEPASCYLTGNRVSSYTTGPPPIVLFRELNLRNAVTKITKSVPFWDFDAEF